jgi:hypothetical protein
MCSSGWGCTCGFRGRDIEVILHGIKIKERVNGMIYKDKTKLKTNQMMRGVCFGRFSESEGHFFTK